MAITEMEKRIFEFIDCHYGHYLFKKPVLTGSTDFDTDLNLDDDEAEELMNAFFNEFDVLVLKLTIWLHLFHLILLRKQSLYTFRISL